MQFEYETDRKVYVPDFPGATSLEDGHYENRPVKTFLTVVGTFTHHYTGDKMCKIRQERVLEDGYPDVWYKVVKYDAVADLWEKSKEVVNL